MSSSDDDLEALGQLASGRRLDPGKGEGKRRQPVKPTRAGAAAESLDDIVTGLSGGRSAPAIGPAGQNTAKAPGPVESPEPLLPASSPESRQARRAPRHSAIPAAPESLENLVYSGNTGKTQPSPRPAIKERVDKARDDQPFEDLGRVQPAAAEPARHSRFHLPPGVALLAVLLVVVGGAFAIYQQQSGKAAAPTALAGQVTQLASAVDGYYQKNQSLPRTLGELEEFPEDAVEWPIDRYGVRLLERRTEYFFDGVSGYDYLIIGRHGEEAWAFVKGQAPELLKVPAH